MSLKTRSHIVAIQMIPIQGQKVKSRINHDKKAETVNSRPVDAICVFFGQR